MRGTLGSYKFRTQQEFVRVLNRCIKSRKKFKANINFGGRLITNSGLVFDFINGPDLEKKIASMGGVVKITGFKPMKLRSKKINSKQCVCTMMPDGNKTAMKLNLPIVFGEDIFSCDVIYFVGLFKAQYPLAKKALKRGKKVIIHWVGSDVITAVNKKWDGLEGAYHIAVHRRLQDELKEIGIEVNECFPHLSMCGSWDFKEHLNFSHGSHILTYLPSERADFYGISKIREQALNSPDLTFHVVGNKTGLELPQNCIQHGWVEEKEIESLMDKCQFYSRFTEHDGLPSLLIMAMQKGLICFTSYQYDGTNPVGDDDDNKRRKWSNYYRDISDPIKNQIKINSILGLTPTKILENNLGLERPDIELNGNPLVSIVIANYNYSQYIDECINSCLEQTYSNIEIVVADDGSTDNSLEKLKKYEGKISLIEKETNTGCADSVNICLDLARGTYISHLSADDICFPSWKIEEQVSKIMEGDFDIIHGDYSMFGEKVCIQKLGPIDKEEMKTKNQIGTPSVLYKRGDKRFDKDIVTTEDWNLWLKFLEEGYKFQYFPIVWGAYRLHKDQKHRRVR